MSNSPETLVYKKSRTLFALNFGKKIPDAAVYPVRGQSGCDFHASGGLHHGGGRLRHGADSGAGEDIVPNMRMRSCSATIPMKPGQKATRPSHQPAVAPRRSKYRCLNIPDAKDPDEFIKKFGAERFEMLLNGSNNAIEYELLQAKGKYDIATPDGRLNYIKDAIGVLAGRITPTERDVYAGRLAEETDVAKPAILNQLDAAIRARGRRAEKERERRLLEEGAGGRINVPYSQGGQKALGVAFLPSSSSWRRSSRIRTISGWPRRG